MLQAHREGDRLTIQMQGELDHYCAQAVRRRIDSLLAEDPGIRCLILDFAQLDFMDSSGIGVILGRYRIMQDRGGSMAVSNMNTHIARIFHMSGMDRLIHQLEEAQA